MKELMNSLFAGHPDHELYLGVIETVEGLVKNFPEDAWRRNMMGDEALGAEINQAINESGLMGLGVSEEHGGMGGGLTAQVLVTDLLAQHGLTSMGQVLTGFCRAPVLDYGSAEQIAKYVGPSISGEKTFCILATEPDAGTNTFNIKTKAVNQGNGWVLNGQKVWVTNAANADYGFLISKTGLEQSGALSVFILDMKSEGVSFQKLDVATSGNESQYAVYFDDVTMPGDALVGREGEGGKYMFSGLNAERLIIAALGIGFSDLALRQTTEYVTERKIFKGVPTGSYQAVQHPLARHKAETEAARLMTYTGSKMFDEGQDTGMYANMSKLLSSEAANNMADACIQFHGGSGLDETTGMMAIWRTTRAIRIAPIANEMVLNYIAQYCIGLPRSY